MGSQRCEKHKAEKRGKTVIPTEEEVSSVRERWVELSCLQMSVTFLLAHQVKVEATQKEVLRGSHEQKQK